MATVVELPRLTDTMEEGVIAQWLVALGDKVKRGQVIAEIETDKATMEFEAFDAGFVLQLVASVGETLPLGAPIAVLGKKGEDPAVALAEFASPVNAEPPEAEAPEEPAPVVAEEEAPEEPAPSASRASGDRIPASPMARRMAREAGLALADIPGSGPHGRVIKTDVERAITDGVRAPVAAAAASPGVSISAESDEYGRPYVSREDRVRPLSQMRKTIVKRMGQSKREAPHIYLTMPIRMDRVVAMRTELNAALKPEGVKVSFNDFILKAVAKALRVHPQVNATYTPEGIVEYGDVHLGVAVALDDGLIVPVVRHADQKSLKAMAVEVRDLATRAKERRLKPTEMSGSTFSVTNLGMFGIEEFMAVINPGEGAILAVGAIVDECVPWQGEVTVQKRMRVTLCSDHRAFDGADNAQFLATLRALLEQPMALFA
jgi:pyruvate dehydrogenase E2 component (dihydrolipoamide acetyltransferase)